MSDRDDLRAQDEVRAARERRSARFKVETDDKGKLALPDLPPHDDTAAQCSWLTSVLHLDPELPIMTGKHYGLAGPHGHIGLDRFGATSLAFEPASRMAKGETLRADLVWQLAPTDREPFGWTNPQAVVIARVVHWLCETSAALTDREEFTALVATYLDSSDVIDGRTFGTTADRFSAAIALRPTIDEGHHRVGTRYLVEDHEGTVFASVRVSDLLWLTRKQFGSTVAHGWLDARMKLIGWDRRTLQGQSISGREGRAKGEHARCDIYRGPLGSIYDDSEAVNT